MNKENWTTKNIPDLTGKVIIVTGGSGLIGKELVKTITKNGGIVIVADIINNLKTLIDERIKFIKTDINSKDTITKMIDKILKNLILC